MDPIIIAPYRTCLNGAIDHGVHGPPPAALLKPHDAAQSNTVMFRVLLLFLFAVPQGLPYPTPVMLRLSGEPRQIAKFYDPGTDTLRFRQQILLPYGEKRVSFQWAYLPGGQSGTQLMPNSVEQKTVSHSARFHPLLCEWLSSVALGVIGVDDAGDRAFEIWTFSSDVPQVTSIVDLSTQQPVYIWSMPTITSRRSVPVQYPSQDGEITYLKENAALADHAFLRFSDTGEVYDCNLATGQLTKQASPSDNTVLLVPELSPSVNAVLWGPGYEHLQDDFIYTFSDGDVLAGNAFFLMDTDRDGTLDYIDPVKRRDQYYLGKSGVLRLF